MFGPNYLVSIVQILINIIIGKKYKLGLRCATLGIGYEEQFYLSSGLSLAIYYKQKIMIYSTKRRKKKLSTVTLFKISPTKGSLTVTGSQPTPCHPLCPPRDYVNWAQGNREQG